MRKLLQPQFEAEQRFVLDLVTLTDTLDPEGIRHDEGFQLVGQGVSGPHGFLKRQPIKLLSKLQLVTQQVNEQIRAAEASQKRLVKRLTNEAGIGGQA